MCRSNCVLIKIENIQQLKECGYVLRIARGLIMQDFMRQVTLQLPEAFSHEIIPAKRSHIPRPKSALQWPHLEKTTAQITPYQN